MTGKQSLKLASTQWVQTPSADADHTVHLLSGVGC